MDDIDMIKRTPRGEKLMETIDEFRKSMKTEAKIILQEKMPEKILELNELLKNPLFDLFSREGLSTFVAENSKKRKIEVGTEIMKGSSSKKRAVEGEEGGEITQVESNEEILSMIPYIKKEVLELVDLLNKVKVWIQLNIPKYEDGNNTGVMIQEETVGGLARAEDTAFAILESIIEYFSERGELQRKYLKSKKINDMNILDLERCIKEVDEKQIINLRLCILDLRNNYAALYDVICKNIEKLAKPKGQSQLMNMF